MTSTKISSAERHAFRVFAAALFAQLILLVVILTIFEYQGLVTLVRLSCVACGVLALGGVYALARSSNEGVFAYAVCNLFKKALDAVVMSGVRLAYSTCHLGAALSDGEICDEDLRSSLGSALIALVLSLLLEVGCLVYSLVLYREATARKRSDPRSALAQCVCC